MATKTTKTPAKKKAPAKKAAPKKSTAVAVAEPNPFNDLAAESVIDAINAVLPEGRLKLQPIPKGYTLKRADKERVSVAFHSAFDLIGGVPGMVAWGMENPTQFYNLYAKLLPSATETPQGSTTINIVSAIPASPLDRVGIDESGNVVDIDFAEIPE